MSDQHNAGCLGVEGHPDLRTPNIDAIARRGTRFTRAYCNNPICGPSRCSLLSGQYVHTHGISGNYIRSARSDAPNIARLFRESGYQTALVGKAHLPAQWVEEGFDHIRFSDLCDARPDAPESCHYFADLIHAGIADLYDQGVAYPGQPGFGNKAFVSKLPEACSLETWTGRQAIEFLQQRDQSRPFFLKVSFQRPHDPYAPPVERSNDYDPRSLRLPPGSEDFLERQLAGKPAFQQAYAAGERGQGYPFLSRDAEELKSQMAAHFTLITMIDDAIGAVLATLERQGELDNTIVLYTADHGDFAGEHGLVLKNLGIYESIHRIPFIIAGPGIPSNVVRDTMIESVDMFPTVAALSGLTSPDTVDGTSRVPEIYGERSGRTHTICEWEFLDAQSEVTAIRDQRYRLVHYKDAPNDGELYDHQSDPHEVKNCFRDPHYASVRKALTAQIHEFRHNPNRIHGREHDIAALERERHLPVPRIHKFGQKWSTVTESVAGV